MSHLSFMLANEYHKGMPGDKKDTSIYSQPPIGWYMSEKYDGYRAGYNPQDNSFYSRQNKQFHCPEWFLQSIPPKIQFDGELWAGRDNFQLMGVVRKKVPLDEDWINIQYIVYDLPTSDKPFDQRIKELYKYGELAKNRWSVIRKQFSYPYNTLECPFIVSEQVKIKSEEHLDSYYTHIIQNRGEGIMIKHPLCEYKNGRCKTMLKYKPCFDAEAIIIDYKPGAGKYKGKLGGFICKPLLNHGHYSSIDKEEDHIFSISGMDDQVRNTYKQSHPINTIITYEYSGKTDKGKPRFARYIRIRSDIIIQEHIQENIDDLKTTIITIFKALGTHEKNNGQGFKASSYFKAIQGIQSLNEITEETLKSVKGIGSSLTEKIMTIIQTGSCPQYDKIKDIKDYKEDFLLISGVGPKKAKGLVDQGFTTIESLRNSPNLKEILNDKQLIGLHYYEDILTRIPYDEIKHHELYLKDILFDIDPSAELTIAGSYRRQSKDSGDIDILLKGTSQLYKQFISKLESENYLYDTLAKGTKKYNGMCKLSNYTHYRRIDIMITTPEEYPFAILYFTGSKEFNTNMRQHSLEKGYSMNEYSLKDINTKQIVDHIFTTEQDIFDYLDYPYVEPHLR
jgi:DNA polymerase beta